MSRQTGGQRTFLDFLFKKAPREIRQPEYEPGWMQVMVWRSRMLDKLRPPPRRELLAAWRSLMQSKLRDRMPLNTTQALQCRRLLQYLVQQQQQESDHVKKLAAADLTVARRVLLEIDPYERSREHLELARALDAAWQAGEYTGKPKDAPELWSHLVRAMCRFGASREALAELRAKWDAPSYERYTHAPGDDRVLDEVVHGLAREDREAELVDLLGFAEEHGVEYTPRLQETVTTFFATRDRVPEAQAWFAKPLVGGLPRPATYQAVAAMAGRHGLDEWIRPVLLELGQTQPRKTYWDALVRSMLLAGMPLAVVEETMTHMVTGHKGPLAPDTATVNSLLRAAAELGDASLAAEIAAAAEARWIRLDAESHLVLLSLHVSTGSPAEAVAAFGAMRAAGALPDEAEAQWTEYGAVMNKLLTLLCAQRPPDFKQLTDLLAVVEEERLHLAPATVAAVCLRFLDNDQAFDVMDILSVHAFTYSEAQREVVQHSFMRFCTAPSSQTSTSRAWGGYQLLHQFFPDLSFDRRVALMRSFFARRRPDMAAEVFSHMRQHGNRAFQPRLDTYVACFDGLARSPDRAATELVHGMLKMDVRVRPDVRLNTALMLAYAAADRPLKALDFWHDILRDPAGPSYASLEAVFWTLERRHAPQAAAMARGIWDRIEAMDLEVPPRVYAAYVGAVAGAANETEARGLLAKMAAYTGSEPDAMT